MRRAGLLAFLLASAGSNLCAQVFLDRLGETLSVSAFDDNLRARVSGTLELEYYHIDLPAPGLIESSSEDFFNPRLSLFLDAQIGPSVYLFVQTRVDRYFDPADHGGQIRLDEYALRITPWRDGHFNFQVGKFGTVIGNWVPRHLSWDNPFINAPLVYENTTPVSDYWAPYTHYPYIGEQLRDKDEYVPVIWGPSYASGISIAGRLKQFEYAAELKNASLSSRPGTWDVNRHGLDHPTVSGRVGFRPNQTWNFGFSASRGTYFRPDAAYSLPAGTGIGDYHQILLAQDVSFAWRHLQIWAEFHEARFEMPFLGDADTFAYYIEAKYKFLPQLFAAIRWGQQFFSDVSLLEGGSIPWSQDISRIEGAVGYRFTEHTQLKVQYYLQHEDGERGYGNFFATQFTVRF